MSSIPEPPRSPDPLPGKPARPPSPPSWGTRLLMGTMVILLVWMMWNSLTISSAKVTFSFFLQQLEAKNVAKVHFRGDRITGTWKKRPNQPDSKPAVQLPENFETVKLPGSDEKLLQLLQQGDVERYDAEVTSWDPMTLILLSILGPLALFFLLFMVVPRMTDPLSSGGMFGSFGRSPARRFMPTEHNTTFSDVANMDNAKNELQEVVEFLKSPQQFQRLGATIPKGILLMGPPGTGKTLLARAVAGEAGVTFYSINGSEFIQMFVGVGASRVRDLFSIAKENAPCVIFIDEIDAVGRIRGAGFGGGHDEREQTLNQILSEMDGFQQNDAVIVLAATNRPDVLDPALLRPGRFDRHVTVDRPNRHGRREVLKVHCRKVPLSDAVDLDAIAATTIGFSGADLKNLVNEAALHATRKGKKWVEPDDFDQARDKVLMGPCREEVLSEHERLMTAYHEAGHAMLAWMVPGIDLVHKVTIIPRGRALGVTQLLPKEEQFNIGEKRLHAQLAFMMGGRAAEKLVFDEYTAGAEDDLNKATQLARRMVSHWGMSEVIGPVAFRQGEEHPFLGKEIHDIREFSEETTRIIDQEVQRFLTQAAQRASVLLQENRDKLDALAKALVQRELLTQPEITDILGPPSADGRSPMLV